MKKDKHFSEPFNEHEGQSCKGHSNDLTNNTYDKKEDRELLISILQHYSKYHFS